MLKNKTLLSWVIDQGAGEDRTKHSEMIGQGATFVDISILFAERASALLQVNSTSDIMLETSTPRIRSCGNLKFIWGDAYTCVCGLLVHEYAVNLRVLIVRIAFYSYA
jgi:hypothetical protein